MPISGNKVGVIGLGFVGKQVLDWYNGSIGHSLSEQNFDAVDRREFVFLCLPTPYSPEYGFDLSVLEENIKRMSHRKNIIIKSTVLPNTTVMMAKKYPRHNFYFNPEFLTARYAQRDFRNPHAQFVGYADPRNRAMAKKILESLPSAPMQRVVTSTEAETIKLIRNNTLALHVVWANKVWEYCQKKDVDYSKIISLMTANDPFLSKSHWDVWQDGFRGFSGACFPKDTRAYVWDSDDKLIENAIKINEKIFNDRSDKNRYYFGVKMDE